MFTLRLVSLHSKTFITGVSCPGRDQHQHSTRQGWPCLPPAYGPPATAGESAVQSEWGCTWEATGQSVSIDQFQTNQWLFSFELHNSFWCVIHVFMILLRMIQEQVLVWARPLPVSTGTFSSWHRNTVATARLHLMSSPKSSRLEINRVVTVSGLVSQKHHQPSMDASSVELFVTTQFVSIVGFGKRTP